MNLTIREIPTNPQIYAATYVREVGQQCLVVFRPERAAVTTERLRVVVRQSPPNIIPDLSASNLPAKTPDFVVLDLTHNTK